MGNILNPSPGDLADRQTILQVKLEHCGTEGNTGHQPVSQEVSSYTDGTDTMVLTRSKLLEKTQFDIQPTHIEHEAIQAKLERDWFPKLATPDKGDEFDKLLEQLKNTNKALWALEDQARVLRHAPEKHLETVLKRKAETLDAITSENDRRAILVKQINALWGIQVQEKVYV
jgi:hypothetical protein